MARLAVFPLGSSEDPRSCFDRTCLFWGGNCALLRFHLFCLLQYLASPSWVQVHKWEEISGTNETFLHPCFATPHLSHVILLCYKKIWNFLASLFCDPALFVPFFLLVSFATSMKLYASISSYGKAIFWPLWVQRFSSSKPDRHWFPFKNPTKVLSNFDVKVFQNPFVCPCHTFYCIKEA